MSLEFLPAVEPWKKTLTGTQRGGGGHMEELEAETFPFSRDAIVKGN